jgi:nucleoside-diphosphate-sugar epimerase
LKILIIGGTGFIGPYLVKELIELGHDVAVFNRGNNKLNVLSLNITYISGDKNELFNFVNDFKNFQPQVVIHMVAFTEHDAQIAMETFNGIAERMVVLSSMDVYQAYGNIIKIEDVPIIPIPLKEDAPLRQKLHPYGGDYEKQLVERIFMSDQKNLPGTVLRLPMVYGEGDPFHRLYKYVKRMLDNRSGIILDELFANWRGSRGYVENVAHAIALAAINEKAKNRIYNVGEEVGNSELEWIQKIGNEMGWRGEIHNVPRSQLPPEFVYDKNVRQDWVMDTSLIRNELGYKEKISLEEAIKRTVLWEGSNPPKELDPRDFPRFNYELEDQVLTTLAKISSNNEITAE